ncbi:MAG: hypothetical protein ABSF87_05940 [Xanthobacteraceae bacterium]|jgi:hypothetical protein
MTDISNTDSALYRREHRHVRLDDDILIPRREFARDELSVSDRTASRMRLPTTYLSNTAYVARNASMKIVAGNVRRCKPKERAT